MLLSWLGVALNNFETEEQHERKKIIVGEEGNCVA